MTESDRLHGAIMASDQEYQCGFADWTIQALQCERAPADGTCCQISHWLLQNSNVISRFASDHQGLPTGRYQLGPDLNNLRPEETRAVKLHI